MIITKILITGFVIFALSRVILRFKEGKISFVGLLGWLLLWGTIEVIVWAPKITTDFAKIFGIGRGVDLIIYGSIVSIFYLIFRIYVKFEDMERQITEVVKAIALKKVSNKPVQKSSK